MSKNITIIDPQYKEWIKELSLRYRKSQIKAAVKVNSEMLKYYWSLGYDIVQKKAEAQLGSKFFKNLSADLKHESSDATCFSETNLKYMKYFYEMFPAAEVRPQLLDENPTSEICPQVEDEIHGNIISPQVGFRKEAGLNAFTLSPTKWVESTNAIGMKALSGRYGGTYAVSDIAFEFASWISVEFKLYLVKEFQRLKGVWKMQTDGLLYKLLLKTSLIWTRKTN